MMYTEPPLGPSLPSTVQQLCGRLSLNGSIKPPIQGLSTTTWDEILHI